MLSIKAVNPSFVSSSHEIFQRRGRKYLIKYPCSSKSQCSLVSVEFPKGVYRVECWGASGGDRSTTVKDGGRGAYTSGEIAFSSKTKLYLSIGASGDASTNGTYGGGGTIFKNLDNRGRSGGGATDVRIVEDEDFEGLKNRIMVAAGGGGAVVHGTVENAGSGGDINGTLCAETINKNDCITPDTLIIGAVATQTSGAVSVIGSNHASNGEFGKGGSTLNEYYTGTGGGGYFGGAAGNSGSCIVATGSGGSSYISGYTGCNSIDPSSTKKQISNTGSSIHFSGFYFTSAEMKNGQQDVPIPSLYSSPFEKGRTGDGCVKITVILSQKMIKTCASLIAKLRQSLVFLFFVVNLS